MQTISTEEQRQILLDRISALEAAGKYPSSGVVVAGASYSASGLRGFLKDAPIGYIGDVHQRLNEIEDAAARRAEIEDRFRAEDLRRARQAEPPDDDELAEARRDVAEAAQRAAHRRSTEGRLDAIETILGEIRDALKQGRS